jgi:L(+)-tartrate dehydratase alpha subunit
MIPLDAIEAAGFETMRRAAISIPADYRAGVEAMAAAEADELSAFVLKAMLENWEAAEADQRPMCADTGLPRFYVKLGNEARIEGGLAGLEGALRRATAAATQAIPLRPNRVHPLTRVDHGNNVGLFAPEIDYAVEPEGDWVDVIAVQKGGLFGSDYRMLFPGDGVPGIKRFLLDVLVQFGRRGLACQPVILGLAVGGSKDSVMTLGKQTACLRLVGNRHPDPQIAALEEELLALGNEIGMGAMGFPGRAMVVDCHVEAAYTHTGGMPVAAHCFCLSSRRAVARVAGDGDIGFREDPQWFTPYQRRLGSDWPDVPAAREASR